MTDLPLIALGGVLGSSHCVGMCGAFALSIGLGSQSVGRNLTRQIIYSSGRIFTYAFLGASAGFAGFWFSRRSSELIHAQSLLSLIAGIVLVIQGVKTLGFVPKWHWSFAKGGHGAACLSGSLVSTFFASPSWHRVFIAGVLNGLLPCGLVYGYLALASSSTSLTQGFATMAAFGIGTVPIMVLTGVGASVFSLTTRRRLFQIAGVCVLLTGILSMARGVEFWHSGDAAKCPGCRSEESSTLLEWPKIFTTSPN